MTLLASLTALIVMGYFGDGASAAYWIALPTCEKTALVFTPISLTMPVTSTSTIASMIAYSATS
jgi:hypothetical protein